MTHDAKPKTYHYRNWLIKAPLGLSLIGMGVCLVADAAFLKYNGGDTLSWVLYGTFALVVLNSGVSILGDAVKHRTLYEIRAKANAEA